MYHYRMTLPSKTLLNHRDGVSEPETWKNAECCHGDAPHEPVDISHEHARITAVCDRCGLEIFATEIDRKWFEETAQIVPVEWERQ